MNLIHAVTTLPAWWMTAIGSPRRNQSHRLGSRLLHGFRSAARAAAGPTLHFWRRGPQLHG
jgi:hypothetical protein